MTKPMLQSDDTKPGRLLVAMEMSLSKWGLAAAVEGQPRKRVKTQWREEIMGRCWRRWRSSRRVSSCCRMLR